MSLCGIDQSLFEVTTAESINHLIRMGANINCINACRITPLIAAYKEGKSGVFYALLDNGADIEAGNEVKKTILMYACKAGDLETVNDLLKRKANANAQDVFLRTPLMYASTNGHKDIVKVLFKHGVDINARSTHRETALLFACMNNHTEVAKMLLQNNAEVDAETLWWALKNKNIELAKLLLEKNASIDYSDCYGHTSFMYACELGDPDIIKTFFDKGSAANEGREFNELMTPFMFACSSGKLEVVEAVYNKMDADSQIKAIAYKNRSGWTPLHIAAANGYLDIAKFLVDHGANINSTSGDRPYTPLMLTYYGKKCHLDIFNYLLDECHASVNIGYGSYGNPLTQAIVHNRLDIVKVLVERGARIGSNDAYGLNRMWDCENPEIVNYLIDKGLLNVKARADGDTCLDFARGEIRDIYLEHGANIDAPGRNGVSVLANSIGYMPYDLEDFNYWLKKGANPNVIANEKTKTTILTEICRRGLSDYVVALAGKTDFNAPDGSGYTGLMTACEHYNFHTAATLLEFGADVNAKGKNGKTALMVACEHQYDNIIKLLLEWGADVSITNDAGKTVLDYMSEKTEIGKLLRETTIKQKKKACQTKKAILNNKLIYACRNNRPQYLETVLKEGGNINTKNKEGLTGLMLTCTKGNVGAANVLLKNDDLNVNAKDKNGNTALIFACQYEHTNFLNALYEHGAKVNACNSAGTTALMFACYNGDFEAVKFLLQHKAKVNARDTEGHTALMAACIEKHNKDCAAIVNILLQYGAKVNLEDCRGKKATDYCRDYCMDSDTKDILQRALLEEIKTEYRAQQRKNGTTRKKVQSPKKQFAPGNSR